MFNNNYISILLNIIFSDFSCKIIKINYVDAVIANATLYTKPDSRTLNFVKSRLRHQNNSFGSIKHYL